MLQSLQTACIAHRWLPHKHTARKAHMLALSSCLAAVSWLMSCLGFYFLLFPDASKLSCEALLCRADVVLAIPIPMFLCCADAVPAIPIPMFRTTQLSYIISLHTICLSVCHNRINYMLIAKSCQHSKTPCRTQNATLFVASSGEWHRHSSLNSQMPIAQGLAGCDRLASAVLTGWSQSALDMPGRSRPLRGGGAWRVCSPPGAMLSMVSSMVWTWWSGTLTMTHTSTKTSMKATLLRARRSTRLACRRRWACPSGLRCTPLPHQLIGLMSGSLHSRHSGPCLFILPVIWSRTLLPTGTCLSESNMGEVCRSECCQNKYSLHAAIQPVIASCDAVHICLPVCSLLHSC